MTLFTTMNMKCNVMSANATKLPATAERTELAKRNQRPPNVIARSHGVGKVTQCRSYLFGVNRVNFLVKKYRIIDQMLSVI